ncbi:MAG: type II toxin-antitoxin system VapC family toxin [Rhodoferax sp.]|nr:type II toxin-antitoxin system VapC family toxin [Rhodoferax sp.]
MQWLLDTCVVSELTQKIPEPRVLDWLTAHAADASLSVVTLGEIQYGIERLAVGRMRNSLQLWFDGLNGQFAERILATDEPVWRTFGRLKASVDIIGRPQEDLDLLIAAVATVHRLTLVTRNTKHFLDTGIAACNPWLQDATSVI